MINLGHQTSGLMKWFIGFKFILEEFKLKFINYSESIFVIISFYETIAIKCEFYSFKLYNSIRPVVLITLNHFIREKAKYISEKLHLHWVENSTLYGTEKSQ